MAASAKITSCTASSLLLLLLLGVCGTSMASARPVFGGLGGGSSFGGGGAFNLAGSTTNTNANTNTGSISSNSNSLVSSTTTSNNAGGITGGQQLGTALTSSAAGSNPAASMGFNRRLTSFTAQLNGANQVPTPVQSAASATFTLVIDSVNQVGYYTLIIRNVAQFTMAHIHQGNAATNGAPIVLLLPSMATPGAMPSPGVVTTLPMTPPTNIGFGIYHGVITPASLITVDPATPAPTWAQFVALLQTGNAYANIHTTAFPAGEIRGQYTQDSV